MHFAYQQLAAWLAFGCDLAAGFGSVYALAAAWLSSRLEQSGGDNSDIRSGLSILKPLHGAEPGLYENLASFCTQDYQGPVQIIFGVQDPLDPAIAIVRQLIASYPYLD